LAFAVAVSSLFYAGVASADNWHTYYNDRYGTSIDYPDLFRPQPPPDANDGRAFKSADGADFAVSATYNALDFNLGKYQAFIEKNLDPGSVIAYRAHGDNSFVVSGTKGNDIFYERHLLSHGRQMTENFVISYPAALKQAYDPIVARMAKSFRSGTGYQSPRTLCDRAFTRRIIFRIIRFTRCGSRLCGDPRHFSFVLRASRCVILSTFQQMRHSVS
jgi:hypothetical protein